MLRLRLAFVKCRRSQSAWLMEHTPLEDGVCISMWRRLAALDIRGKNEYSKRTAQPGR